MSEAALPLTVSARAQLRRAEKAVISTLLAAGAEAAPWPYGSLVLVASDPRGAPLLYLSDLSDHTRNLKRDPRASLLIEETAGFGNPLAGPRITLMGPVERIADDGLKERFFRRFPKAKIYKDFADFGLYRMTPERLHSVGGFAKAEWVEEGLLLEEGDCAPLAAAENSILEHMNADHGDALALIAEKLLDCPAGAYRMSGVDPEGFDLSGPRGGARCAFEGLVTTADACREALVSLTQQARRIAEKDQKS